MSISLNTIKPSAGSTKKKKRIGRGNASGHGTYSTKGIKGQKARSGVSGLKRLGMKKILLATPKKRGFISLKPKAQVVGLALLNASFKDGEKVSARTLLRKGLVGTSENPIKILGKGELKIKNLRFEGVKVSQTAKEQIEKMGGKIQ